MEKEKQKKEALERMSLLRLHPNVIKEFSNYNIISYSENSTLYWLKESDKKIVEDWQDKTGNLVYHAIYNSFFFGRCLTLLFVSRYEDEWKVEKDDLISGYAMSYVINLDDPICSEYGSVGILLRNGGVVRIS